MLHKPFFDPGKSYEDNYSEGPFADFADNKVYGEKGEPQYQVFGNKVYLPFGIPAGPLINGKFVNAALDKGFDIPVYKTVRTRAYKCHPWPNVLSAKIDGDLTLEKANEKIIADNNYTEPLSITNSFGNPSRDPEIWQNDLRDNVAHAKKGQMVWASCEGTPWEGTTHEDYIKDWAKAARLIKETGAHAVEANFSCPNEGTANLLCFDIDKVRIVCEAMKNEIGNHPLVIKTAYYKDQSLLERLVKEVGSTVDGFATINTIQAEVVDYEGKQALPGEGRARSGICGSSIKWAGLDMVKRLKKLREEMSLKYTIVGVGGVMSSEDYEEYRKVGADVVMSATGAMWNPLLAQEIRRQLTTDE